MSLTPKRVMRLKQSLNSTAEKVYATVPIREAWELKDILAELARTGKNLHVKGVHGSLKHMVEIGLIREVRANTYQQVPIIRTTHTKEKEEEEIMVTPVTTLTLPKKPNDYDALQARLSAISKTLFEMQNQVTSAIDDLLALQVNQEEEAKKYQKIAELLDAIGSLKK